MIEGAANRRRVSARARTAAATLEQRVELKGPSGRRSMNLVGVTPELGHRAGRTGLRPLCPAIVPARMRGLVLAAVAFWVLVSVLAPGAAPRLRTSG